MIRSRRQFLKATVRQPFAALAAIAVLGPIGASGGCAPSDGAPFSGGVGTGSLLEQTTGGWQETFADDFDGTALDLARWNYFLPWGSRTNPRGRGEKMELQHYEVPNVEVSGGTLKLIARPEPAWYAEDGVHREFPYSSGCINTAHIFSQRYGRAEIRAKMPGGGPGPWAAFWLLHSPAPGHWPWPPEIDVLEYWAIPTEVTGNMHYGTSRASRKTGPHIFRGPDYTAGFHTFATEWAPGRLTWFVDGQERHRVTANVPDVPMYLVLNLAIGGWAPMPTRQSIFPMIYEIDYVRVWQHMESVAAGGSR